MAEDLLQVALDWIRAGDRVCIARVVETWGSSPRPAGSMMLIALSGRHEGSVSAGCVESAVIEAAKDCFSSGSSRLLEYGVSDERAWEVGLTCGGRLQVFVEPLQ